MFVPTRTHIHISRWAITGPRSYDSARTGLRSRLPGTRRLPLLTTAAVACTNPEARHRHQISATHFSLGLSKEPSSSQPSVAQLANKQASSQVSGDCS